MKKLLCLLLILSFALAAEVSVGTYLLSIGNYDISQGTYDADFYLWFKGTDVPTTFEFMNGKIDQIRIITDEPDYKFYRVRANLFTTPQFAEYPNDHQTLSIVLEDSTNFVEDVHYVADTAEIGIDPALSILGWQITDTNVIAGENHYANWGESYPRYEHYITIGRPGSSLLKILFPVFFIALIGWFALFVPHKQFEVRATLGFSALLSAVAFHMTVSSSIPPVGYLTLADTIMIALYAFVVFLVAVLVGVEVLEHRRQHKLSVALNRWAMLLALIVPFVVFLVVQAL